MRGGAETENWRRQLTERMPPGRYRHCLSVAGVARRLAEQYGVDTRQAELAGLVHDYARDRPAEELRRLAETHNLVTHPVELCAPVLLHAPVGAWLVERELGIDDPAVLQAIRRHTVGAPGMSDLDKILFLADAIEPGRNYPGVEDVRRALAEGLERALLRAFDSSLGYVLQQGGLLHPQTVEARNYLLEARSARC